MPINIFNKIVNYIAQSLLRIELMIINKKNQKASCKFVIVISIVI